MLIVGYSLALDALTRLPFPFVFFGKGSLPQLLPGLVTFKWEPIDHMM